MRAVGFGDGGWGERERMATFLFCSCHGTYTLAYLTISVALLTNLLNGWCTIRPKNTKNIRSEDGESRRLRVEMTNSCQQRCHTTNAVGGLLPPVGDRFGRVTRHLPHPHPLQISKRRWTRYRRSMQQVDGSSTPEVDPECLVQGSYSIV